MLFSELVCSALHRIRFALINDNEGLSMMVVVQFDTLNRNAEGIASCLAKEMRLHYNEI